MDNQIAEVKRQISAGDNSQLAKLAILQCRSGDHVWESWETLVRHPKIHRKISERFFGKDYQRTRKNVTTMKRECFWCGVVERLYRIELYPGNGGEPQLIEVRV